MEDIDGRGVRVPLEDFSDLVHLLIQSAELAFVPQSDQICTLLSSKVKHVVKINDNEHKFIRAFYCDILDSVSISEAFERAKVKLKI